MKMKSYEFDLEKEETLFRGERQLMERMIEKHHRVDPVLLRWIVTEILWKRNFVLRLSPQAFDSCRPISEMKSRPSLLMRPRISTATGTKESLLSSSKYFVCFLVAAFSAAQPASIAVS